MLPSNIYAGIIFIDLIELTFIIVDVVFYRFEKLNFKVYVAERVLTFIAINTSIFATDSLTLLVVAGLCMAAIFLIKIYFTGVTVK